MSYPRSLDEMSTKALKDELWRRHKCFTKGLCHYCERPLESEPSCKMQDVHKGEEES